jgi:nucleotide-binding universal stress UspA family protein
MQPAQLNGGSSVAWHAGMSVTNELKTILIGLDFTDASDAALEQGAVYARAHGAKVVLVHASGLSDGAVDVHAEGLRAAAPWASYVTVRLREAEARLAKAAAKVAELEVEVATRLVHGFADAVLVSTAQDVGADLVVVGTHGRSGIDRWLLGSVAERVTRLSTGMVLVARPLVRPVRRVPDRVLCATDFSEGAALALEAAVRLLPPGGSVDLVHAFYTPFDFGLPPPADAIAELRERAHHDGERLARAHASAERRVRFEIIDGEPVHALVEHLAHAHHELLVVGSHGRRGVRRLLVGSVAEALTRRAPCSTLVVHADV